jgi:tRNA (cytidine/uridine-2'-O-)-methyltransferase
LKNKEEKMVYFSSSATKSYTTINFEDNMFFLFGKESVGLSKKIIEKNSDSLYKIPIYTNHVRSLNLANAVSIVVYEGLRNLK